MKIKTYVDYQQFSKKPTVNEIKKISSRILSNKRFLTPQALAFELAKLGKTTVLAEFKYGEKLSSKSEILGQQVLMLDFDNNDMENQYTIEDLKKDDFMQHNASFYYETFTSTEKVNKFRVVFILEKPILSYKEVEKTYKDLFEKYPMSDTKVGQTNRLFFGTNKGYTEIDFDNRLYSMTNKIKEQNPNIILDKNTPNHLLFRYKKYDIISEKLGDKYRQTFPDESVASSYFRTIDIRDFLELPDDNPFLDIFHEEENPSASIFQKGDNGVYLYKCFSENNYITMDLLKMITLLTGLGMFPVIELLTKITGSIIDTDSDVAIKKRKTNVFIDFINRREFEKNEPVLYSWLGRYIPEITTLLQVINTYVWQDFDTGEVRLMSFLSTETLADEVSLRLGYKVTTSKMKNVINLLTMFDGLWKLSDNEIPNNVLSGLNESKTLKGNYRRNNVLEIKEYSDTFITDATIIAEELKKNNVTMKGLSFELLYRIFDEEKATKVFPQSVNTKKDSKISKDSLDIEKKIVMFIEKKLIEQNYVFEQDIIYHLNKKMYKSKATYKLQQMRADICNKYGLTRERYSKKTKEMFNIKENVSPKIIYYRD